MSHKLNINGRSAGTNINMLAGSVPSNSIISKCYDHFREEQPNSDAALRSWNRLRQLDGASEMNYQQRMREFKRHASKIEAMVSA